MKDFARSAFNVAATMAGSIGTVAGLLITAAEATGFPNGLVDNGSLLQSAFLTALAITTFTLGYNRLFFSGKTSQFLQGLRKSNSNGPQ